MSPALGIVVDRMRFNYFGSTKKVGKLESGFLTLASKDLLYSDTR